MENRREPRSMQELIRHVSAKSPQPVSSGTAKRLLWFGLANIALVAWISILSGGALLGLAPILLLLGIAGPFFYLLISKWIAKRTHHMQMIPPDAPLGTREGELYRIVAALSEQAGLPVVPEVGIYESADMNAFATGMSRNRSLVAFSTGLLEAADDRAIAAVAAHEIAHVANGDMVTMALVQSVVNTIVFAITIPLRIFQVITYITSDADWIDWLVDIGAWIVRAIVVLLGTLVVFGFSRRREFAADALAASLVSRDAMIHALEVLDGDEYEAPAEQKALAAFKIKSRSAWWDLFSTHPSIPRRIAALREHVG